MINTKYGGYIVSIAQKIALIFTIIGGLNWGLVGFSILILLILFSMLDLLCHE